MGQWRQLSQMTTEGVSSCTVYESTFYSSTRAHIIDFMQAQYMYFKCHVAVPDQQKRCYTDKHCSHPVSMTIGVNQQRKSRGDKIQGASPALQKVGRNVPLSTHGCTPMSMTAHTGFKNTVNYCYLLS